MPYVRIDRMPDGIELLTIDRPPANALDLALIEELAGALEGITATADPRATPDPPGALVIAGRLGFFSAGVDLKAVPEYGADEQRRMVSAINRMVLASYLLELPVVAAITGHAIAGGLVLALCADHRIVSEVGRYGLTEVKVGVPYPQAAIGVVRAELPPHATRQLALGNQLIGAGDCLRLGVFDEVVAPAAVLDRALALAAELTTFDRATYARTKLELRRPAWTAMRAAAETDPLLGGWL